MNTQIADRWLKHAVRGIGKDRSSQFGQKFYYVGPIMYSHTWPVGRIVRNCYGNYVLLYRSTTGVYGNPKEWKSDEGPKLLHHIHVLDIGAASRFPGDVITDEQLHQRTQFLAHLECQDLIEQAEELSGQQLFGGNHPGHKRLAHGMKLALDRYQKYGDAFRLRWDKLPDYAVRLELIIQRRLREYTDPKAVAKRERVVARREAKIAFGLDQQ